MKLRSTNCRNVRNVLPLHAGGDLDPRRAAAVDEHLHACLSCFREFRELVTMRGRLGVLAEQPLPQGALDGFTEEVMARIAVGEPGPRADVPRSVAWHRHVPRLAAAAVLLLVVGIGAERAGLLGGSEAGAPLSSIAPPASIASAPTPVSEPRNAELPPWWAEAIRRPARARTDSPSNRLGSALFDFLPAGQDVTTGVQGGLDALGPSYGNGLVPEPGRELRPRYPRDQR